MAVRTTSGGGTQSYVDIRDVVPKIPDTRTSNPLTPYITPGFVSGGGGGGSGTPTPTPTPTATGGVSTPTIDLEAQKKAQALEAERQRRIAEVQKQRADQLRTLGSIAERQSAQLAYQQKLQAAQNYGKTQAQITSERSRTLTELRKTAGTYGQDIGELSERKILSTQLSQESIPSTEIPTQKYPLTPTLSKIKYFLEKKTTPPKLNILETSSQANRELMERIASENARAVPQRVTIGGQVFTTPQLPVTNVDTTMFGKVVGTGIDILKSNVKSNINAFNTGSNLFFKGIVEPNVKQFQIQTGANLLVGEKVLPIVKNILQSNVEQFKRQTSANIFFGKQLIKPATKFLNLKGSEWVGQTSAQIKAVDKSLPYVFGFGKNILQSNVEQYQKQLKAQGLVAGGIYKEVKVVEPYVTGLARVSKTLGQQQRNVINKGLFYAEPYATDLYNVSRNLGIAEREALKKGITTTGNLFFTKVVEPTSTKLSSVMEKNVQAGAVLGNLFYSNVKAPNINEQLGKVGLRIPTTKEEAKQVFGGGLQLFSKLSGAEAVAKTGKGSELYFTEIEQQTAVQRAKDLGISYEEALRLSPTPYFGEIPKARYFLPFGIGTAIAGAEAVNIASETSAKGIDWLKTQKPSDVITPFAVLGTAGAFSLFGKGAKYVFGKTVKRVGGKTIFTSRDVIQPIIKGEKQYAVSTFRLKGYQTPIKEISQSRFGSWFGFKPTVKVIQKGKTFTATPLLGYPVVTQEGKIIRPSLFLTTSKGGRTNIFSLKGATEKIEDLRTTFDKLPLEQKFVLQRLAEARTGVPVSLENVPFMLSKSDLSLGRLEATKLFRKTGTTLTPLPYGKRVSFADISNVANKVYEEEGKFALYKTLTTLKPSIKTLQRSAGKTPTLMGISKVYAPKVIDTGEEAINIIRGTGTGQKSILSSMFNPQEEIKILETTKANIIKMFPKQVLIKSEEAVEKNVPSYLGGTGTTTSAYAGLNQYEQSLGGLVPTTTTKQNQFITQPQTNKMFQANLTNLLGKAEETQANKFAVVQAQPLASKTKQAELSAQKFSQKFVQKFAQKNVQKVSQKFAQKFIPRPIPSYPKYYQGAISKKGKGFVPTTQEGFNVFTFKGGKKITLFKNVPQNIGMLKGSKAIRETLRASFGLESSGKTTTLQDIGRPNLYGFVPSKRKRGVFVEQAKFRLNRPQEKIEIFKARRSKPINIFGNKKRNGRLKFKW